MPFGKKSITSREKGGSGGPPGEAQPPSRRVLATGCRCRQLSGSGQALQSEDLESRASSGCVAGASCTLQAAGQEEEPSANAAFAAQLPGPGGLFTL